MSFTSRCGSIWCAAVSGHRLEPLRHHLIRTVSRKVLNHVEPQESLKMQLKAGVRYVTGLSYGGHGSSFHGAGQRGFLTRFGTTANQFISIGKLLFLARELNRVAIM